MLNRKISEKLIHTLELKIFRQDGVDSINSTRPWVSPFWISSIQVNVTLGFYNNPQKTCRSYFFSITKLFVCFTNTTIICLNFFNKILYAYNVRKRSWKRDVTIRFSHQLLSLHFPRPMTDQVNIPFASPSSTVMP